MQQQQQQQQPAMYNVRDMCRLFRYSAFALYKAVEEDRFPVPPTIGGTGTKQKLLWAPGPVHFYLENGQPPPDYVRAMQLRRRGRKDPS